LDETLPARAAAVKNSRNAAEFDAELFCKPVFSVRSAPWVYIASLTGSQLSPGTTFPVYRDQEKIYV
jgi:hypothetical protein